MALGRRCQWACPPAPSLEATPSPPAEARGRRGTRTGARLGTIAGLPNAAEEGPHGKTNLLRAQPPARDQGHRSSR